MKSTFTGRQIYSKNHFKISRFLEHVVNPSEKDCSPFFYSISLKFWHIKSEILLQNNEKK